MLNAAQNAVFGPNLFNSGSDTARIGNCLSLDVINPVSGEVALSEANFDEVMWKMLHADPKLIPSSFPVNAPPIFRMLDSEFRAQVFSEAILKAKTAYSERKERGPFTEIEELDRAREEAFSYAREYRHSLHDLWVACKDKSLITLFGTSSKTFWTPQLEDFMHVLAKKCVEVGVTNINGGADCGLMGRGTDAWRDAIKNWNDLHPDAPTNATVILVLLYIYSKDSPEPPADAVDEKFKSHPLLTFMTRTRLMFALAPGGCSLIFPGALGTEEESGVAEADEQIGARVIRESVAEDGLHIGYVNSPVTITDPHTGAERVFGYWDGMQKQHQRMDDIGAFKNVSASIVFYEPGLSQTSDEDIAESVAIYCKLSTSSHSQTLDPHEELIRTRMQEALDRHRTFNMSAFGTTGLPYHPFLDAQYAGQVRLEAETLAMELILEKDGHQFEDTVIDEAVEQAVHKAVHWRGQLRRLIDELEGQNTIIISGTGKDSVLALDQALESYAQRLVDRAVLENTTLVIQGDGKEGISRIVGDLWAKRMLDASESKSKLVRLQLKMQNEMGPGRRWDDAGTLISDEQAKTLEASGIRVLRERLGPPIASALVRSHAALCLGNVQEVVVFPGDSVNLSFAAETLLARQLSEVTLTPFSSKKWPIVTFVDAHFGQEDGFFAGLREQLETYILCGTAKSKDLVGVEFVNPGSVS